MTRAIVLVAICLLAVGVAGCTQPAAEPPPSGSPSRAPDPVATDKGVRPVRTASGVALSYLQPESASQVLCQALPVERWQQLLGSKVGRRPAVVPPESGCFIGADTVIVGMSLGPPGPDEDLPSRVARRPTSFDPDGGTSAQATVALSDDYRTTRPHAPMRPLLTVTVTDYQVARDAAARRRLLTSVLDVLVPVLAAKGEQLPAVDHDGNIGFTWTPVTPSTLVDLPKPIQALQLCTALADLGRHDLRPHDTLGCLSDNGPDVSLDDTRRASAEYTQKVGGRPAVVGSTVNVRLRDDVPVGLVVSGDGAQALADKLVPALR